MAMTQQEVDYRRARIAGLYKQASSTAPVAGPIGAIARGLTGALAGYDRYDLNQSEAAGRAASESENQAIVSGLSGEPISPPPAAPGGIADAQNVDVDVAQAAQAANISPGDQQKVGKISDARILKALSNRHASPAEKAYLQAELNARAQARQPADPFTLGRDQVRYGGDGSVIARGPAGAPKQRIIKGADGYNYDANTGERVLPGVEKTAQDLKFTTLTMPDGTEQSFPSNSPDLTAAVEAGGVVRKGGTTTSVNIQHEKSFGKEFGKLKAKRLFDSREKAQAALDDNSVIREGEKFLDQGINSGPFANLETKFDAVMEKLGYKDDSDGKTSRTQAYGGLLAQRVLNSIKALGSGTAISDADREFTQSFVGGDITATEGALRRLLDIGRRANAAILARHNKLIDRTRGVPASELENLRVRAAPAEKFTSPQGVDWSREE